MPSSRKQDVGVQEKLHAVLLGIFRCLPDSALQDFGQLIFLFKLGNPFIAIELNRIDRHRTQPNTTVGFRFDNDLTVRCHASCFQHATRNRNLPLLANLYSIHTHIVPEFRDSMDASA